MRKILVTLMTIIHFFWINMWHSEIIQTVLKWCITTNDFNTNDNINSDMPVYHQLLSNFFQKILMIMFQSSPSTRTFSQALAHFRLEMIFLNSINKPYEGPYFFKRLRGLIKHHFNSTERWSPGRNRFRRCTSALNRESTLRNVWYVARITGKYEGPWRLHYF